MTDAQRGQPRTWPTEAVDYAKELRGRGYNFSRIALAVEHRFGRPCPRGTIARWMTQPRLADDERTERYRELGRRRHRTLRRERIVELRRLGMAPPQIAEVMRVFGARDELGTVGGVAAVLLEHQGAR